MSSRSKRAGAHRAQRRSRLTTVGLILAIVALSLTGVGLWMLDSPVGTAEDAGVAATRSDGPADQAARDHDRDRDDPDSSIVTQPPETPSPSPTPDDEPTTPPPDDGDTGDDGGDGDDSGPGNGGGELENLAAKAVDLTNVERQNNGCGPVTANDRLTAAALGHSQDMADNDYFDHTSQDGRTPWDRAEAAGYHNAIGENIAMGYTTAESVIDGWMNSEGHRANILNCDAAEIGIGVARSGDGPLYWTQMFGAG